MSFKFRAEDFRRPTGKEFTPTLAADLANQLLEEGRVGHIEVLTPEEVAEYLRIPLRGVYGLVRDGRLTSFRAGERLIRILKTDLDKFIADGRQSPITMVEEA